MVNETDNSMGVVATEGVRMVETADPAGALAATEVANGGCSYPTTDVGDERWLGPN